MLLISPGQTRMRLYCWPCTRAHELTISEVEQVVYALGGMEADADYAPQAGSDPRQPTCLLTVLKLDAAGYAEHVAQGVAFREAEAYSPSRAGMDAGRQAVEAFAAGVAGMTARRLAARERSSERIAAGLLGMRDALGIRDQHEVLAEEAVAAARDAGQPESEPANHEATE